MKSPDPNANPSLSNVPDDRYKSKLSSIHAGWRNGLIVEGEYGAPKPCLYNATHALSFAPEWEGVLGYDLNSSSVTLHKPIPPPLASSLASSSSSDQSSASVIKRAYSTSTPYPRPWEDIDSLSATLWLQSNSLMVGKECAYDAADRASRTHPFHPIRDYLSALIWDGEPRLETWLTVYLGVEPTPYSFAVGSKFLIGAVARAMSPGCKMDTCMILEGKQGKLKSTALATLAVNRSWFTDQLPALHSKDSLAQLRGMWIVELAELEALQGAEVSKVKMFLSASTDRYRPHYAHTATSFPRQTVFTGSVNHASYMHDETGARRFWPVEIAGRIDIDELTDDRDQLWAEATELFMSSTPWWIDSSESDLLLSAQSEQSDRYDEDIWTDAIHAYTSPRSFVTTADICKHALELKTADMKHAHKIRVGRVLQRLGWVKTRPRMGDGSHHRGYVKSTALQP